MEFLSEAELAREDVYFLFSGVSVKHKACTVTIDHFRSRRRRIIVLLLVLKTFSILKFNLVKPG